MTLWQCLCFWLCFTNFFRTFAQSIIKTCIYFSDGAPQQFKNSEHFLTIYYHKQDLKCSVIWHLHATAHGKGPYAGADGALKIRARKASLQRSPNDQITTPLELYRWAQSDSSESNISVAYANKQSYNKATCFLKQRFDNCTTVPGTQKIHCVKTSWNCELKIKTYLCDSIFKTVSFLRSHEKK